MEMDTDPLEGSSYNVNVKAEIKNEEDDHYNTMRKVYRVSWGQLEILSNFFNTNKSIAIGLNRTLQAKEQAREKWRSVADLLNAERGGIRKDFTGWAKYWLDYKGKLKKRAAALRASRAKKSKKPSTEIFFNEVEKKFLQILGEDIGEPLPAVQVEKPPKTGTASTNADVQDSSASELTLHDPEVDNPTQNPPSEPNLEPLPQNHVASTHVNMQNASNSEFIFLDPGPDNHTQNPPSEPILDPLPQNHDASTHMNMHNSSNSEFIYLDPEVNNPTQNPPSEPILEPLPQTHADQTHMDMHDPSQYKFIFLDPEVDNPAQNPPLQPSLEPMPQTHADQTHMDMHDPSAYKFILLDPEAVNHTQNPPLEPSLEPQPQTHTASTHMDMHNSSAPEYLLYGPGVVNHAQNPPLQPSLEPLPQTHATSTHMNMHNSTAPEFLFFGPRLVNPVQNPPLESRLQPEPQTYAAPTHMHDSSASESFHFDPTAHNLPLEPLPQNPPPEPVVHDPPAHSSSRGPTLRRATPPAARSRLWRRRRVPSLSQEAARRALVRSTQMHAKAAVRIAEALEKMVQTSTALGNTASRIERALLELAQCVQTNQEPIEFNSTDAMMDPKTGLMICLHCLEDFDPSLLSDHMINAHNYRRVLFKCHLCQNTFQERKLLIIHRQECQPEPKVRKRKTFQQIMREVESKYFLEEQEDLLEPVACPICLLELPKYCLKEHLLNEHRKPDVILTCGRCNRNFKSKLTLREHVKLVHEAIEDSEECELCGQKFRSLKYLSNHKRNVHPSGNKIHKCAVCGKEFKSRLCLHQHSKYVHPPESASVECPHCPNKMFKSRINLTQHLKVSHGWKRK